MDAHRHQLAVHPYTFRTDDLPGFATSADDLLHLLFVEARVDGLFADFPDVALRWVAQK